MSWTRETAVAGTFYPREPKVLEEMLQNFCSPLEAQTHATAIVVPHAGYIYSGRIAGEVYRQVTIPNTVIILCPNHSGHGKRISIWTEGCWKTPLGEVKVDGAIAQVFMNSIGESSGDTLAHAQEHAIEVHLPFLLYRNREVKILPVCLGPLQLEQCQEVGEALAKAVASRKNPTLIIASTDMSHYISAETAKERDAPALKKIECLDGAGLYTTVVQNDISMCGFIPTSSVLFAAHRLGSHAGRIVAYGNSGDTNHDYRSVVAYAGAVIT